MPAIHNSTTTLPLAGASVTLVDSENKIVASSLSKENGAFEFDVFCETSYSIKANKEGYEGNSRTIITSNERNATKDASLDLYSIVEKEKAIALIEQTKLEQEKLRAEA